MFPSFQPGGHVGCISGHWHWHIFKLRDIAAKLKTKNSSIVEYVKLNSQTQWRFCLYTGLVRQIFNSWSYSSSAGPFILQKLNEREITQINSTVQHRQWYRTRKKNNINDKNLQVLYRCISASNSVATNFNILYIYIYIYIYIDI